MSEIMNVPEGWENESFKSSKIKLIDGDRGENYPKDDDFLEHGYCVFLSAKNVTKQGFRFNETQFISQEKDEKLRKGKLERDDIVLTTRGTVGNIAYYTNAIRYEQLRINSGMILLRNENENLDNQYFHLFLKSGIFENQISNTVFGSAQPQLTVKEIEKFFVSYPKEKKEQQKIAKILSTLDKTIESTAKLIDKEKNIKKGLMHDLLTNGIDSNGKIRTPQTHTYKQSELGLIPEEWVAENINLLVKNLDSKRIPLKEGDRQEIRGQYPYYGASGIIDRVDDYIFDGEYILLGEDGENVVSRVLPLAFKATGKIWVNNHAHVFQCKKDVNIDYVVNLLESTDYKSIINGSAQPKITQDGLNKLLFKIASKNEQKQIAKILTTQDKKIQTEETNLAKLKELKKGLMNDLLSGKVRVKI